MPAALGASESGDAQKEAASTVEVDLGEYSVTVSLPNSTTTLRVDFKLYGTVSKEEAEEIKSLFEIKNKRFSDLVLYEIRNSASTELADAGLTLIKRRILEKSNTLFGKPILRSVGFYQFSHYEQ